MMKISHLVTSDCLCSILFRNLPLSSFASANRLASNYQAAVAVTATPNLTKSREAKKKEKDFEKLQKFYQERPPKNRKKIVVADTEIDTHEPGKDGQGWMNCVYEKLHAEYQEHETRQRQERRKLRAELKDFCIGRTLRLPPEQVPLEEMLPEENGDAINLVYMARSNHARRTNKGNLMNVDPAIDR